MPDADTAATTMTRDDPTIWRVDDALWAAIAPLPAIDKARKEPGLVPTTTHAGSSRAIEPLRRLRDAAGDRAFARLAGRRLITATCGVGLREVAEAEEIVHGCPALATLLRDTIR